MYFLQKNTAYTGEPCAEDKEMTPEQSHRVRAAMKELYESEPESTDFIEAIMNRITKLESRVKELEMGPCE